MYLLNKENYRLGVVVIVMNQQINPAILNLINENQMENC